MSGYRCPKYDAFCAKLMDRPARPVVINTPVGPIRFTADRTLKPGEFRIEQPDDRVPMSPLNYASLAKQFELLKKARITWLKTTGTMSGTFPVGPPGQQKVIRCVSASAIPSPSGDLEDW